MINYPPIQIVDKNDQPIGGASLGDIHKKGLIHRVVIIFVEDGNGSIIIQKRGPNVVTYPNRWDVSAAGHVDEGESYLAAAQRELAEELGIYGSNLQETDSLYIQTVVDERILNRFIKVYKTVTPKDTAIILQESEVAAVRWLTIEKLRELISEYPEKVHDDLSELIEKYY